MTLASFKPSVRFGNQTAAIDPMVLFSCLVVLMQGTNNISSYFAYELASVLTIQFKNNMMQKPKKLFFAKRLDTINKKKKQGGNISDIESDNQSSDEGDVGDSSIDRDSADSDDADIENVEGVNKENVQQYVVDRLYLLHRAFCFLLHWTYHQIIQKCINYVESHYGKKEKASLSLMDTKMVQQ